MILKNIYPVPMTHKLIWWLSRAILLTWGIDGLFHGTPVNLYQGIFGIACSHLWEIFNLFGMKSFVQRISYFKQTVLNIFMVFGFVFSGRINFYAIFPAYDLALHFISGCIAAWLGYDFALIIQGGKRRITPALAFLFSLAFSMAVACGWEIYEFFIDRVYGLNLQTSNPYSETGLVDTMFDLIYGVAGGFIGMIYCIMASKGNFAPLNKKSTTKQDITHKNVKGEPEGMT